MSSTIVTPSNFDAKKLTVSEIKKLDNGASQVYINYDGKRLRVRAPRMPVPYDSGDYQGNEKFKVQFSFRDRTSNPKVQAYFDMLKEIDDYVIDQGVKNAGKWFKMAGASRDMIKLFYSDSTKLSKDKEGNIKDYPPTQSVALKKRSGAFDAEIYDNDKQLMEGITPVEALRRGAEVTPVIDAASIWVSDKKFGITWKLHQAVINVPGQGSASGCLIDDDEDDGVVVAKPAASKKAAVSADEEDDIMAAVMPTKAAPAAVASDDEDDDEDDVVEAPPVPVKKAAPAPAPVAAPAVKKVVKKKTTA